MGLTKPRAAQIYNLDYKQSTRVVTVTNITLAGGAPSLVDGVTLSLNDRILVTGQSTGSQNGLYKVATVGSGSNGTWSRTGDADQTGEIDAGMIVMVTEGTIYADTQWKLTTDDPITVGTTALTFVQNYSANSIAAGNSNVTVLTNANVLLSSAGTANVVDVFGTGIKITGTESVTGNITGGNLLTSGLISATGNITGDYFLGNVFYANGITASKIYSGNSEVNVTASGGNVNVSIGGTSNVAVFADTGEYVTGIVSATGNVTAGNILTAGLISATGNIVGGNISTAGNITGSYLNGNASQITGVNTFSQIFVTGATTVNASGLTSNVTFAGGSNISLTSDGSTITIAYSAAGSSSIFATGGDMGLIADPVTSSEDLGNVTTMADTSYDLGTLFTTSTFNQIDMTGFTSNVNTGNLNATGLVSAAGNVTGAYILGNGSLLTGVTASFPLSSGNSNISAVANGNIAISVGGTANVAVFSTSGVTANNFYGNGAALTGITSTPPPLNINLQQNYGGF